MSSPRPMKVEGEGEKQTMSSSQNEKQTMLSSLTTPKTPEEKNLDKDTLKKGAEWIDKAAESINNTNDLMKKTELLQTMKAGQPGASAFISQKAAASVNNEITPFLNQVDKMKLGLTQAKVNSVEAKAESSPVKTESNASEVNNTPRMRPGMRP
jgi:hypothetical protein